MAMKRKQPANDARRIPTRALLPAATADDDGHMVPGSSRGRKNGARRLRSGWTGANTVAKDQRTKGAKKTKRSEESQPQIHTDEHRQNTQPLSSSVCIRLYLWLII